jgi:micrococcal nuclease
MRRTNCGGTRQDSFRGVLWAIALLLFFPSEVWSQPSTIPPSSLTTAPLSPNPDAPGQLPTCDLCRAPEPRAGNTILPHRLHREKGLHPHKKPKGTHRSNRQSLRSLLPHHVPERIGTGERTLESGRAKAIDGDTIRYGVERIRIRGLNAPELTEPGGREALERLSQLLREGSIRIVPHGKDMSDRTIADVFVNGQNVAEVLTREGFTKP